MNGVNKVILLGTLGQDPQELTSREGKTYSRLNLATNYYMRNEEGKTERKTNWHRVHVWGKKADLCKQFLKKGSNVYVEGYIANYESDEDGVRKWHTFVNANDITFIAH